jgi:hypothetical protein
MYLTATAVEWLTLKIITSTPTPCMPRHAQPWISHKFNLYPDSPLLISNLISNQTHQFPFFSSSIKYLNKKTQYILSSFVSSRVVVVETSHQIVLAQVKLIALIGTTVWINIILDFFLKLD